MAFQIEEATIDGIHDAMRSGEVTVAALVDAYRSGSRRSIATVRA